MRNSTAARASCCRILIRRAVPWPKTPSAELWKSPEPNGRRRSSCAAQLDLRASTVQMAEPRQYPKYSRQFLLTSTRSEICLKSKKQKPCSGVDKWPGAATGDRSCQRERPGRVIQAVIPLSGNHGQICLLPCLAAVDPMRHDRAENFKAAGNAASTGRPS